MATDRQLIFGNGGNVDGEDSSRQLFGQQIRELEKRYRSPIDEMNAEDDGVPMESNT